MSPLLYQSSCVCNVRHPKCIQFSEMVFDSFYDSCTCHIVIDVIQRDRAITVKLYEVQIALSLVDKQVASPPRLQTEAQ